jgi:hypothetical protein
LARRAVRQSSHNTCISGAWKRSKQLTNGRTARPGFDQFPDGAAFRDYFKAVYGPTIAAYRNIEGDPDRVVALDADIARIGDGFLQGGSTMEWEYLLVTARKA